MSIQEVHHYLESNGVNPSVQRVAIMQYMLEHWTHPTVDQIYSDLLPIMPTLSKATVYNTLKLFVDKKAVNSLFIDERNVRYDAVTSLHAHFKCKHCGSISDVPLEEKDLPKFKGSPDLIPDDTQIYFLGFCTKCINSLSHVA